MNKLRAPFIKTNVLPILKIKPSLLNKEISNSGFYTYTEKKNNQISNKNTLPLYNLYKGSLKNNNKLNVMLTVLGILPKIKTVVSSLYSFTNSTKDNNSPINKLINGFHTIKTNQSYLKNF